MTKSEFLQRFHHLRSVRPEADFSVTTPTRNAAVLVPLVDYPNGLQVLFTQRAKHLRHHPGEISFPGGGEEHTDRSLVETALRETQEEVGIPSENIEVIGALPPYRTISGYSMTPIVGVVRAGVALTLDKNEVDSAFEVPLSFLIDRRNHLIHHSTNTQTPFPIYFMPWQDKMIWGATAAIIRNLSHHLHSPVGVL
ncbi:CoA pyrophosphatase [Alteromonas sp. C1M14]|uniref:CoA pyrophosphatase n=1 Tax=Alteromonas sp. C1M14 TaxID=2841567 RepID=UPI001C08174B|nr:CoA pyrophosphatase [Alteromonas sp. C1M14]MBU2976920.1 CoA pyrophosphatase [Alteromonas sp. C1M14]